MNECNQYLHWSVHYAALLGERTISRLDIYQPIQCLCNLYVINGNEVFGLVKTLNHECTQPVGITTADLQAINDTNHLYSPYANNAQVSGGRKKLQVQIKL